MGLAGEFKDLAGNFRVWQDFIKHLVRTGLWQRGIILPDLHFAFADNQIAHFAGNVWKLADKHGVNAFS